MAMLEVTVIPLGTGQPGVSRLVAAALRELEARGVRYQLTPMGTVLEGDLDELLRLARHMHEAPFRLGVKRVITLLRIDDRRDRPQTVEEKLEAVRRHL